MHDWQSLSHVRWECKYHMVIIPKYRREVFYGRLRRQIGPILRELCRQRASSWCSSPESGVRTLPVRAH
jgi:putative transposase